MIRKILKTSVAIALAGAAYTWAADPPKPAMESKSMDLKHDQPMMLHRAHQIIGTGVYDAKGDKLGDVNDLVLNGGESRINYAVLSYGGLMGVGDKLFAMPWSAFEHKPLEANKLFLNIDRDRLAKAPGFDKKNWPDQANAEYWSLVDTYYPRSDTMMHANPPVTDKTEMAKDAGKGIMKSDGIAWTRKVSAVLGADVKNTQNESLGEVQDLVIDGHTGKVQYAVLSFGGLMGFGDKLFAIPIGSLQGATGREFFILDISKDRLKNAPGFNKNQWPDFADPQFRNPVDSYYR
jgi:sporulation protein YlmC with PRC-barrel domain